MTDPTKKVVREYKDTGFGRGQAAQDYTDTTEEHLCSVELGATAKGGVQIKSVKAYALTVDEAAESAWRTYTDLETIINGSSTGAEE